jgi:hypothetical protein
MDFEATYIFIYFQLFSNKPISEMLNLMNNLKNCKQNWILNPNTSQMFHLLHLKSPISRTFSTDT